MKSLLLAPALVSLVHSEPATEPSFATEPITALVAIAQVAEPRPIIELDMPPPFVPVVVKEDERVNGLKKELEDLSATLKTTRQAVDDVAKQRDEAREETRALAKANHGMLEEMKAFRKELEDARAESAKWKEHAAAMERKANDQALANAALQQFRDELQGTMKDFEAMKGDIAKARAEFADPIERASLKEELAKAKAKQERLGDEIEMALIAREKAIQESAQMRKEMEGRMANLMKQAQEAEVLRDELRGANAVKMKALADIEVLRKGLAKAETAREETLAKLETAQNGLTALQAEKAAAMEAGAVATRERDESRTATAGLQNQVDALAGQLEQSRNELAATTGKLEVAEKARAQANSERDAAQQSLAALKDETAAVRKELETAAKQAEKSAALAVQAEQARKQTDQKLADASGTLEKTKEEVAFLNKAKGGLEDLLFKKTAEIRKLKGELRKEQASGDDASDKPAPAPEEKADEEIKRATAQALAD